MSESLYLAKGAKLKWNGIYDMNNVYKKMKQWFDSKGYDFKETQYLERAKPNGTQLEISWKATKKASDYFLYTIEVLFLVIGMNKVEVERDERKFKLEKGEIEIQFTAYLIKDYKDRWKEMPLRRNIYEKFIVKDRIEGYKGEVYENVYGLMSEVKTMLELFGV